MPEKKADLHVRTTASNGRISPIKAVKKASKNDLDAIAIADRDSVDGVVPAIEAGETFDVEVIPGVELTSVDEGREIHILGYFIDPEDSTLRDKLSDFQEARRRALWETVENLQEYGLDISLTDVVNEAGEEALLTRTHLARALVTLNIVESTDKAFEKFLGRDKPAYERPYRNKPWEAMELIRKAGGVPALAHPLYGDVLSVLPELSTLGLEALEVYHHSHSPEDVNELKEKAQDHDLVEVGGTDGDGIDKPPGTVTMPLENVEDLRALAR